MAAVNENVPKTIYPLCHDDSLYYYTRMIKKFKRQVEIVALQKVREQGIRFWDERTFWYEIILNLL